MNFTCEQMVSAIRFAKAINKGELDKLFDAVRVMLFYEFIDESTYDAFCEQWKNELFGDN